MQWSTTGLGGTCLFILGLGGGIWLFPGDVTPAQSQERSPAEIIAFRFPANWNRAQPQPSTSVATAPQRMASIGTVSTKAPYALASADTRNVPVGFQRSQEQVLPTQALAYAAPEPEVVTKRATAAPHPHERRAHIAPAPRPVKQSTRVFSDNEIAVIRTKLKLSPQQQQYWPAVASALRNIDYVRHVGGKSTSIDPNSPGVQQLKSAAFPLIMSFHEEQKNQVRQLARNMGLEQVAASF